MLLIGAHLGEEGQLLQAAWVVLLAPVGEVLAEDAALVPLQHLDDGRALGPVVLDQVLLRDRQRLLLLQVRAAPAQPHPDLTVKEDRVSAIGANSFPIQQIHT